MKRRVVTETHAWCNKGQHMVEHDGFAKGQQTCRECRRAHYNRSCNYSQGKACADCGTPVANTNRNGRCRACHCSWAKSTNAYSTPRRWVNAHGYVVLNQHHGRFNADDRGQVLEHVKVMSELLGRALLPGENVHHVNGVRDDNRPENLELWVTSQPSGQRPADLVAWAHEILRRYDVRGV